MLRASRTSFFSKIAIEISAIAKSKRTRTCPTACSCILGPRGPRRLPNNLRRNYYYTTISRKKQVCTSLLKTTLIICEDLRVFRRVTSLFNLTWTWMTCAVIRIQIHQNKENCQKSSIFLQKEGIENHRNSLWNDVFHSNKRSFNIFHWLLCRRRFTPYCGNFQLQWNDCHHWLGRVFVEDFCVRQGHHVGHAFDLFQRLTILRNMRDKTVHHHLYERFGYFLVKSGNFEIIKKGEKTIKNDQIAMF